MAIRKADRQTLQAIATIALNPSKDHKRKVTLVVVTPALLGQWQLEIFEKSKLHAFLYHGVDRERNARQMISVADVILTTYTVLAREAPKGQIVSILGWRSYDVQS
jgi:SNF2 family DNA or RNA helicase